MSVSFWSLLRPFRRALLSNAHHFQLQPSHSVLSNGPPVGILMVDEAAGNSSAAARFSPPAPFERICSFYTRLHLPPPFTSSTLDIPFHPPCFGLKTVTPSCVCIPMLWAEDSDADMHRLLPGFWLKTVTPARISVPDWCTRHVVWGTCLILGTCLRRQWCGVPDVSL